MAQLICIEGLKKGLTFDIEEDEVSLGRGAMNSIILPHYSISRKHASIKCEGLHIILTDLNSLNGTFVNDQRISTTLLKNGDTIKFGELVFEFKSAQIVPEEDTFIAKMPPEVKLICQEGMEKGFEIKIEGETAQVGRDETNQIKLFHKSISRKHCRFSIREGRVLVTDLNSTNGTYVNDQQIQEQELRDNDEIRLGDLKFAILIKQPVIEEQTQIFPDTKSRVSTLTEEDFSSLDLDEIEGTLIHAELQSSKLEPIEAYEEKPKIAEQNFINKILSIERDRQHLFLLFEASKTLMSMLRFSDYQEGLASVVANLFSFKNMLLVLGKQAPYKVIAQKGELRSLQLTQLLSGLQIKNIGTIHINSSSKPFAALQKVGAAGEAMIAPIAANAKKIGIFYLDSDQTFTMNEQQIFELFVELLSIGIKNVLKFEARA